MPLIWNTNFGKVENLQNLLLRRGLAWNQDLLLEPRVGIEKWLSPWLSAGVMVGSDVLRDRDLSVTLGITGHSSAFDSRSVVALPD